MDGDADVEDPLGTAARSTDLERDEPHRRGLVVRDEAGDEDVDGADEEVAAPRASVDLDEGGGGVGVEELVVDAEEKPVVPFRVVVAFWIDACG